MGGLEGRDPSTALGSASLTTGRTGVGRLEVSSPEGVGGLAKTQRRKDGKRVNCSTSVASAALITGTTGDFASLRSLGVLRDRVGMTEGQVPRTSTAAALSARHHSGGRGRCRPLQRRRLEARIRELGTRLEARIRELGTRLEARIRELGPLGTCDLLRQRGILHHEL